MPDYPSNANYPTYLYTEFTLTPCQMHIVIPGHNPYHMNQYVLGDKPWKKELSISQFGCPYTASYTVAVGSEIASISTDTKGNSTLAIITRDSKYLGN